MPIFTPVLNPVPVYFEYKRMTTSSELKNIFAQVSAEVQQAFAVSHLQADGNVTPEQLIEKINQFFILYDRLGSSHSSLINKEEISQIGEQAINCLVEMGVWADKLDLPKERAMLEEIALDAAHWVIRHKGEIRNLDEIVNMLAAKANRTTDPKVLTSLFHVMNDVIQNSSTELKNDTDKSEPGRPWRMLNFNFAIVATRTMDKELMIQAFDTLGLNLPEDCPAFFEEGLRQSEKSVYGPEIKTMMAEYFKKWATLH